MLPSTSAEQSPSFTDTILLLGKLVRFSHTIFALPFAMSMLVILAGRGLVAWQHTLAILIALVSARTAAMAFNRLIDHDIDAKNPRTQLRELPSGTVSRSLAWVLCLGSAAIFLGSSALLGMHCLILAPLVLGVLFFYSVSKRFTASAHLILGLALALAPGGVWYAITATVSMTPVYLMLAVLFWVAGFDVLYSCQDHVFDKAHSLHSIPVRAGIPGAFRLAKLFHVLSVIFLAAFGLAAELSYCYATGVVLFAVILMSQYRLVSPESLEKIDIAFFSRNGLASVLFFVFVTLDCLQRLWFQ